MIDDVERRPSGRPQLDVVTVRATLKNPVGSPGSVGRAPDAELRDEAGRTYVLTGGDGWSAPVQPDTEIQGAAEFEVAEDALHLELVLAPGSLAETHVRLT